VSFTASADTVYLSGGGSVSFNDLTAGATSRSWTFGDGQTSTAANPTVVYTQPGNYKVRLQSTDASGCSNFAEKTIVVLQTVSTDAPKDVPALVALFPNPASGQLFLEFGTSIPDGLQISVFDMLGRAVLLVNKVNFVGQTAQVDISSLPPGVYTVQASGEEQFNWAGKFVKK
jgi:PKD repeat protein